jgi:hypothetical protein
MERLVLFILVFIMFVDFAEDGHLVKIKYSLPNHPAKISFTSSYHHPCSGQNDCHEELASSKVLGSPSYGKAWPESLSLSSTLQFTHCCHLSSSGGIPKSGDDDPLPVLFP